MSVMSPALFGAIEAAMGGAVPSAGLAPLFNWRADLADPIPPGFSFTRASARKLFDGAAFVDFASGAIPIVAGPNKGLSADPLRTNEQFNSTAFSAWTVSGAVVLTDLGADPIGLNAYDLDTGGTNAVHAIFARTSATVSAGNYVFSVIGSFVDRAFMFLRSADPSAFARLVANLQAGTISAASASLAPTVARSTALASGWNNVELGWTSPGAGATPNTVIGLNTDGANLGGTLPAGFTGNNSSIKIAHAQTERTDDNIGAVRTSPLITSGAAATRQADVLSGVSGLGITRPLFAFDSAFRVPDVIPTGKRVVALAAGSNVALIQVDDQGRVSMFDGTTTVAVPGDRRGQSVAASVAFDGTNLTLAVDQDAPVSMAPAASPVGQPIQIAHQAGDRQLRDWFHHLRLWAQP